MCLAVWGWKVHPEYPLIFIANRDERYQRPTQPLHLWDTPSQIYAGKDDIAGGTWAGMGLQGQFAALTNVRKPKVETPDKTSKTQSRGMLVKNYLAGRLNPDTYIEHLESKSHNYEGFNLLVGNMKQLIYYANQGERPKVLHRGIYGLSNADLYTAWPKVEESKVAFTRIISRRTPDFERLFVLMQNTRTYPATLLPDTGIPLDVETALSASFIQMPEYGTRSTLLMVVNNHKQVTITEKTYLPHARLVQEKATQSYTFELRS